VNQLENAAAKATIAARVNSADAHVARVLNEPGRPLPARMRAPMEARFGHSLASIRVHDGDEANDAATRMGARAFTVGRHVAFRAGDYRPGTFSGDRLIGHELAHAVQQGFREPGAGRLKVGTAGTAHEREATMSTSSLGGSLRVAFGSVEPHIQRQDAVVVDVDLEVPPAAEVQQLHDAGINLPQVSAASADPKLHSSYVERRLDAIGDSIYLGGFLIYLRGLSLPIFVSDAYLDFALRNARAVGPEIYGDRPEADRTIPFGPWRPGDARPFAYHRVPGTDVIVPTVFSPATTPTVITTLIEARRELARQVQEELTILAMSMVGGVVLRWALRGLIRWSRGGGRSAGGSGLGAQRARAAELARAARARGEPVIANLGGAGSANEPAGAININNQAVPRQGIPNLVEADAADVGQLLPAGSVDRVEGYRMAPGAVDWGRGAPGAYRVLRPGGTFRYSYQGANADAQVLARALRGAGFRDVQVVSDVLVTAVK
jgi:hypothetical protein